jgi:putative restriction endonuclease
MSATVTEDLAARIASFRFLEQQCALRSEGIVTRQILAEGFEFRGHRLRLIGPQGIFKPAFLEMPISITTVPVVEGKPRPYDDEIGTEGTIKYRYRGTEPEHPDNAGLRRVMRERVPLIYNYGIVPGEYLPVWPVYVVADDRASLLFHVAVDEPRLVERVRGVEGVDVEETARRSYVTIAAKRRLHQEAFRERVLRAYREICAICRLRHRVLLDAAHILPDGHPAGLPVVSNGLSLCKLHHAAFDRNILGIRADLTVDIRLDILEEQDGPMLEHGLQGFQGTRITVPRAINLQPNRRFLDERYELFRTA